MRGTSEYGITMHQEYPACLHWEQAFAQLLLSGDVNTITVQNMNGCKYVLNM